MKPSISIFLTSVLVLAGAQLKPGDTGIFCDPGFFNNGNYCERCPPRSVSDYGAFFCTPCPPGLFAPEETQMGFNDYPSACSECSDGYYINATRCVPCPVGSYSTGVNSTRCIPCPNGGYTSYPGGRSETSCFTCEPGSYLFEDFGWGCEPCSSGEYQDQSNQKSCKPCPRGTSSSGFAEVSATSCTPCPPGTYSPVEVAFGQGRKCLACPDGFYSSRRAAFRCPKCPKGTAPNIDRTACQVNNKNATKFNLKPCVPGSGREYFGEKCSPCPKGTATAENSVTECVHCTGDLVPSSDRMSCKCPANFIYNRVEDLSKCIRCPDEAKKSGESSCTCPEGQYFVPLGDSSECRCRPFTKKKRSGSCVLCNPEELKRRNAIFRCNLCKAGEQFSWKRSRCVKCPIGMTSKAGDKRCRPCDLSSTKNRGEQRCVCRPGEELRNGKCIPCPLGTYYDLNFETCYYCPVGQFTNKTGQRRCQKCPEGQRYDLETGRKSCPPKCPANGIIMYGECRCDEKSIFVGKGAARMCKRCPLGKVSRNSNKSCVCRGGTVQKNGKCVQCPPGTIAYPGARKCMNCDSGTIPNDDQSACTFCSEGTFSTAPRGTKCYACKDGTFHTKSGTCGRCKAGFRVRNGECVACVDSVSDGGDVSYCRPCENGTKPSMSGHKCV